MFCSWTIKETGFSFSLLHKTESIWRIWELTVRVGAKEHTLHSWPTLRIPALEGKNVWIKDKSWPPTVSGASLNTVLPPSFVSLWILTSWSLGTKLSESNVNITAHFLRNANYWAPTLGICGLTSLPSNYYHAEVWSRVSSLSYPSG